MEQQSINQRLKFLANKLADSTRAFGLAIGDNSSNTHKYLNGTTRPNPEYLEKVLLRFGEVDARWLITGEGEPFKEGSPPTQNQTNISGDRNNVASGRHGTATTNNYNLSDCEKERDTYKRESDDLRAHLETQKHLLDTKDALIASKEELLGFLRGGFNRPN